MLALPLIAPGHSDILPPTHFRPRPDSPPRANAQDQLHRQQQHRRDEEKKAHNARSPLALLAADEAAIAQRKAAIRNFGAYWIRPPGVSKTLQAMNEEAAEAAEQEEMMRQEQGLRDMQAMQQVEEARARANETTGAEDDGEERDLDDDIPDAEAEAADVTFNEESMMEGSHLSGNDEHYAIMEEAELTGAARDEEDLGIEHERDLDDSVPEAGSYQHTDTEVEDSTDDDSDLQDSFAQQSARRRSTRSQRTQQVQEGSAAAVGGALPPVLAQGGLQERIRAQTGGETLTRSPGSLNLSSSLLESSFVGSSPVMQRGPRGREADARSRRSRHS